MARTGEAFLAYLRAERGLSTNTVDAYKQEVQTLLQFILDEGLTDWAQVTHRHIRGMLLNMTEAKYRRSTIRRRVSALRTFWKFLMREEQVTSNPFILVDLPKERKLLPRYLEESDAKRLLKIPGTRPVDLRDRALLHLAYSCGLRVAEVTGLRLRDVLPNAVRVFGKGSKERIIPTDARTLRYVRAYVGQGRPALMNGQKTDRVFLRVRTGGVSGEGHPLDPRSVRLILAKYCQQAGIPYINPHGLRHSIATHMLDHGADIRIVQEFLGHASINTTQVYAHVSKRKLQEAVAASHPSWQRGVE